MPEFLKKSDIFDPKRIERIFEDKRNIVVRAADAETLDGFTADFGYTYYPYPHTSVFRTPAVASNGVLSRIQHRFWSHWLPNEYKKGMGKRHIAVLVYAAPGAEIYFDIQWCDKVLGRVKVDKLDGNRHLLVLEDPVVSAGNMEVLQIITDCKNICRIEYFGMLEHLPESDLYTPKISDFTASHIPGGASLDFLTRFAARTSVKVEGSDGRAWCMEKDALHTVHSYDFIASEGKYTAKIKAETAMGEKYTGEYPFEIKVNSAGKDAEVPIEILSPRDMPQNTPLTFGAPIKKGTVYSIKSAELSGNPVQARVLSYWEDGSVKWLLCDSVLPRAISKSEVLKATLCVFAGKPESASSKGAAIGEYTVKAGKDCLPFGVYDKTGKEIIAPVKNAFEGALGNGAKLICGACSDVKTEEDGLYRTVLKYEVPLVDSDGTAHFINTVRVICDRRDSTVTLKHRLNVVSPILEPALMGDKVKIDLSKHPASAGALDGDNNEEPTIIRLKYMRINCDAGFFKTPEHDGKTYNNGIKIVAMSDLGYKIIAGGKVQEQKGRASGELSGEGGSFAVKNFWQLYPKSIEFKEGALSVGILPEIDFEFPETDGDAWHRLYFCYRDGQYRLKTGIAPTTELVFSLNKAARGVPLARCAARPEINYMNSCSVFPYITPKDEKSNPEYEECIADGLVKLKSDLDKNRCYGFHNFGDWYGESGYSWGNNEYDGPFCYLMEFLRGGEYDWFELGANAARHLADIDTVNYSLRKSDIGAQHIHIPGHCGGYLPPYFKNKGKGSRCKPSHAWMEGAFMYYAITGDEIVLESLLKSAEWFINCGIQNYDFHNCREAGWHLIHLCGAYRVSGERKYLNAAKIIAEKALSKQEKGEGGGWLRQLTSAHCGCHTPHCMGEAGFMLALLIVGLGRYYDITKDERVRDSIVRAGRWLVRKTFNYETGNFVYTNCPVMVAEFTQDGFTRHTTEPLAKAWELSGDPEIEEVLKKIKYCVGDFDESEFLEKGSYMGYGKCLCYGIRNTPLMLETYKKIENSQKPEIFK